LSVREDGAGLPGVDGTLRLRGIQAGDGGFMAGRSCSLSIDVERLCFGADSRSRSRSRRGGSTAYALRLTRLMLEAATLFA
jgi:hypothetical protein